MNVIRKNIQRVFQSFRVAVSNDLATSVFRSLTTERLQPNGGSQQLVLYVPGYMLVTNTKHNIHIFKI